MSTFLLCANITLAAKHMCLKNGILGLCQLRFTKKEKIWLNLVVLGHWLSIKNGIQNYILTHGAPQKFFQRGKFPHPFQVVDDAMQVIFTKCFTLSTPQRNVICYGNSDTNCLSLAELFVYAQCKSTGLTVISIRCISCQKCLRSTVTCGKTPTMVNSRKTLKICHAIVTHETLKSNSRTICSRVSQPAFAGKWTETGELQAHHCMTPEHWTWLLYSVSAYRQMNYPCKYLIN